MHGTHGDTALNHLYQHHRLLVLHIKLRACAGVLRSCLLVVLYYCSLNCVCSNCSRTPCKLVVTFIYLTTAGQSAQDPMSPIPAKSKELSVNLCFTWFPWQLLVNLLQLLPAWPISLLSVSVATAFSSQMSAVNGKHFSFSLLLVL